MHPLPKWVTSNEESVWRETEQARRQTPAERWRDVVAACDTLKLYWSIPGYPERVKNAVDPMPESSRVAFARLRAQYKAQFAANGARVPAQNLKRR